MTYVLDNLGLGCCWYKKVRIVWQTGQIKTQFLWWILSSHWGEVACTLIYAGLEKDKLFSSII